MGNFRPKAVFEQAQLEEARGNLRLAASHYASVGLYLRRKGKLRESRRLMLKAIQLHPSSARLYLHLAHLEALLGNEAQAATSMRAFCSTATMRGRLREYESQVQELIEKFPGLVAIYYTKWLQTDRTEPRVHLAAAICLERSDEASKALEVFRQAFELAPNQPDVRSEVRAFLERQMDSVRLHAWEGFEAGRLTREQMLSVLSDSAAASSAVQSGTNASERSQVSKIDESFTMDKSLSAMIASLEEQLSVLGAPETHEEISDIKPLVAEFRRNAEQVLRDDDAARWDMGHAFAEMGLNEEAIEELKKIPPQSEWYIRSLFKQAEVLSAQGSLLGALDCLQTILRSQGHDVASHPEALYQAAHVYFQLGDWEQCGRHLEWLEKIQPGYRDGRSLRLRLEEARKRTRTGT